MTATTLPRASGISRGTAPVAELFYSFQGEGPNLGRRALFARFSGCNLTCGYAALSAAGSQPSGVMACDTEYTWNTARHDVRGQARYLTPQQIWTELTSLDPATASPSIPATDLIVITGGEPLLHRQALMHLAQQAARSGRTVEIETNATIRPGPGLAGAGVFFNAGLKLATSAVTRAKRVKPAAIAEIQASGRARWKFVVTGPDDLSEISDLQREFGLTEIWLSPAGTRAADVLANMRLAAVPALDHGWHLTTREHILIWGDQRGR